MIGNTFNIDEDWRYSCECCLRTSKVDFLPYLYVSRNFTHLCSVCDVRVNYVCVRALTRERERVSERGRGSDIEREACEEHVIITNYVLYIIIMFCFKNKKLECNQIAGPF